jgi:hypothetical protein
MAKNTVADRSSLSRRKTLNKNRLMQANYLRSKEGMVFRSSDSEQESSFIF